jgi:hypothetical protein
MDGVVCRLVVSVGPLTLLRILTGRIQFNERSTIYTVQGEPTAITSGPRAQQQCQPASLQASAVSATDPRTLGQ